MRRNNDERWFKILYIRLPLEKEMGGNLIINEKKKDYIVREKFALKDIRTADHLL